jgi:hypothetical protein
VDGVLAAEDSDAVAMDDALARLSGQTESMADPLRPGYSPLTLSHGRPGRARPDIALTGEDFADLGLCAAGQRPYCHL